MIHIHSYRHITLCISVLLIGCSASNAGRENDEFAFTAEDIARFREWTSTVENDDGSTAPFYEEEKEQEEGVPFLKPLGPQMEPEDGVVDLSLLDAYGVLRSGTETQNDLYKVNNAFLNVRANPSITSESVARLVRGDPLQVIEFVDAAWARVLVSSLDREGYVAQRYIARIASDQNLQEEKEKFSGVYFVDFAFLNVRKEPDANSGKLGELAGQALVRPISMDDTWARVPFEGKEGYVAVQYLSPFLPAIVVRQDHYRLPILRFDLSDTEITDYLSTHIKRLQSEGMRFMTMRQLYDLLLQQEKQDVRLPPKSVILALTNGTTETVHAAANLLQKQGVLATFFPLLKDMGKSYITEQDVRMLLANGFDVQSGGWSGEDFRSLTNAQLSTEMLQSRHILEKFTNRMPVAIAYPSGGVNNRVANQAEDAGYLFGIGVASDMSFTREQLLRLPSILVQKTMSADSLMERLSNY